MYFKHNMEEQTSEPEDSPIICFQHCEKDANIICLQVPSVCPICNASICDTPMKIPPFRLPCPLKASIESPFSVVIKPSFGTFLKDFTNASNLHLGVTDVTGAVYHFEEAGFQVDAEWEQCLGVPLVERWDAIWEDMWKEKLLQFAHSELWTSDKYHDENNNCYQFVLQFLNFMNLQKQYPSIENKSKFCEEMILPNTTKAAKYIALYRKLVKEEMIVQWNTAL